MAGKANAGQIQMWKNTYHGTSMCFAIDEFKTDLGMVLDDVSIRDYMTVCVGDKS